MEKIYKTCSIKDLIPYENNPRINADAVKYVAESIKQCEYISPIVVDENMVVLAGHTRLRALKKLKRKQCEILQIIGMNEEQKKKYRLLDNKTGEFADWDFDLLEEELEGLDFGDLDIYWGIDDIGDTDSFEDIVEDDFEGTEKTYNSKVGDIWQLGNHRLMCGDSTNEEHVKTLMQGKKADMVFTDPPYGYKYQSNMRSKNEKFDVLKNDDKILDFFPLVKKYCEKFVFVCTTWKVLDKWIKLFQKYQDITNMIIWNKGGGGLGDLEKTFSTDYEVILCDHQKGSIQGKRIGSVWDIAKDASIKYEHPTQKPVKLPACAIEHTTKEGDIVLDLFGGSGSTLIACEQLDRKCYMMEYDPKYIDVIIGRWERFTDEKAKKVSRETK